MYIIIIYNIYIYKIIYIIIYIYNYSMKRFWFLFFGRGKSTCFFYRVSNVYKWGPRCSWCKEKLEVLMGKCLLPWQQSAHVFFPNLEIHKNVYEEEEEEEEEVAMTESGNKKINEKIRGDRLKNISHLSTASSSASSPACPPCRSRPLSPLGPAPLALPSQRGGIHPGGRERNSGWEEERGRCAGENKSRRGL